jgi:hypothetical protein
MTQIIIFIAVLSLLGWYIIDKQLNKSLIQLFVWIDNSERIFVGEFESWKDIENALDEVYDANEGKEIDYQAVLVTYTEVEQVSDYERFNLEIKANAAEWRDYREQLDAWSKSHKAKSDAIVCDLKARIELTKNMLNES